MLGPSINMGDAFFKAAAGLEKPVHAWTVDTPAALHRSGSGSLHRWVAPCWARRAGCGSGSGPCVAGGYAYRQPWASVASPGLEDAMRWVELSPAKTMLGGNGFCEALPVCPSHAAQCCAVLCVKLRHWLKLSC